MSVKPISRDVLRGLKYEEDRKMHYGQLKRVVEYFYEAVLQKAKISTETKIEIVVREHMRIAGENPLEFNTGDITKIITSLKSLFPGCLVEYHSKSNLGNNGYILIDWS